MVLAEIGGRAPVAEIGRGAVIIGEGVGRGTWAVIMKIADRVGQRPVMVIVAMMPVTVCVRGAWEACGGEQEDGCGQGR